tara:strand:- start:2115 stop:2390 length:276 start_codon:yes stop_codon:yes gene_type:complete
MKNYLIGLFVILIIFIIYLMNFSQSSFFTYLKLKNEVKEKNEILDSYKKKSEELKKNIKKLNSNDLQYIEEIARDKHDMSKPDENIIFNKK